jgi:hypothetical protein
VPDEAHLLTARSIARFRWLPAYDCKAGALRYAVGIRMETFKVEYPSEVLTAVQSLPLKMRIVSSGSETAVDAIKLGRSESDFIAN